MNPSRLLILALGLLSVHIAVASDYRDRVVESVQADAREGKLRGPIIPRDRKTRLKVPPGSGVIEFAPFEVKVKRPTQLRNSLNEIEDQLRAEERSSSSTMVDRFLNSNALRLGHFGAGARIKTAAKRSEILNLEYILTVAEAASSDSKDAEQIKTDLKLLRDMRRQLEAAH